MTTELHFLAENEAAALRLGAELGIDCRPVSVRQFPDGESLVRVEPGASQVLLFCTLDRPDTKLIRLLLAASALRDGGASRIVLVAPYLAYMRQDRAFSPGEAVSQRVIGRLIASNFDGLVTVDPHLHRTPALDVAIPGIAAVNVSAAETLARALAGIASADAILIGPDSESRPWVEAVAAPLGLEMLVGNKVRHGDRTVEIVLPGIERVKGRQVILVDDLISSGGTLIACAKQLFAAQASKIGAVATHCLASRADLDALAANGIAPVIATDSVPGDVSTIPLAPALAQAIRQLDLW